MFTDRDVEICESLCFAWIVLVVTEILAGNKDKKNAF